MRLLRVLLVAILGLFAVVAGLLTAAAVSIASALVYFVRRALGQAPRVRPPSAHRRRFSRDGPGEVIDVTATEVPVDPAHR